MEAADIVTKTAIGIGIEKEMGIGIGKEMGIGINDISRRTLSETVEDVDRMKDVGKEAMIGSTVDFPTSVLYGIIFELAAM